MTKKLRTLFEGFDWEYSVLDNEGDQLLVLTNYMAPNYKVVKVDPKNPAPENWTEVIPEKKICWNGSMPLPGNFLPDT